MSTDISPSEATQTKEEIRLQLQGQYDALVAKYNKAFASRVAKQRDEFVKAQKKAKNTSRGCLIAGALTAILAIMSLRVNFIMLLLLSIPSIIFFVASCKSPQDVKELSVVKFSDDEIAGFNRATKSIEQRAMYEGVFVDTSSYITTSYKL